jgi:hypothetical protein
MASFDLSKAKTSFALMTPEQVRQEAQQKAGKIKVEMYDWEHRRLETAVPATTVRALILELRDRYVALRAQKPEAQNEDLRKELMSADARFRDMGNEETGTHPRLFEKVTQPDLTPEHMALVLSLCELRRRHESGAANGSITTEQATKEVTAFFNSQVAALHNQDEGKKTEAQRLEEAEKRVAQLVDKDEAALLAAEPRAQ